MARTYLALGSNMGDRLAYLRSAVQALPAPLRCSRVYETTPVGTPDLSKPFLNAVVEIDYSADPCELLSLVISLEQKANRVRKEKNGPRTLDVDVIYVEGFTSDDPRMTIPHPLAHTRSFVLVPLSDLNVELVKSMNRQIWRQMAFSEGSEPREVFPGVNIYGASLC